MNKILPSRSMHYDGLYKEESPHLYDYIFCEEIQTRSKDFQWEIGQHFHSRLFQFFLVQEGKADFYTDSLHHELEAPFFVFIPSNCNHGFRFSEQVQGNILTFSDFYINAVEASPNFAEHLSNKELQWRTKLSDSDFEKMKTVFNQTQDEVFANRKFRTEALQLAIINLLLQLSRLRLDEQNSHQTEDRNLDYFRKFTELVQQYHKPFLPINQYAADLHISAGHLNRICRLVKNKSALQIIQESVIRKAKIFLHHTTYSVNEVAYQLGINDPSYFIRLFKKQTGLTPGQFRSEKFQETSDK